MHNQHSWLCPLSQRTAVGEDKAGLGIPPGGRYHHGPDTKANGMRAGGWITARRRFLDIGDSNVQERFSVRVSLAET